MPTKLCGALLPLITTDPSVSTLTISKTIAETPRNIITSICNAHTGRKTRILNQSTRQDVQMEWSVPNAMDGRRENITPWCTANRNKSNLEARKSPRVSQLLMGPRTKPNLPTTRTSRVTSSTIMLYPKN